MRGFRPCPLVGGSPDDLRARARPYPDRRLSGGSRPLGCIDPPGAAFVFCRESSDPAHAFHARMFAPPMGVPEDPATGSAAAAFAGVLSQFACPSDGEHAYVIEQGYEMGRPSLITLFVTVRDRQLSRVAIGGQVVSVSEGTIEA